MSEETHDAALRGPQAIWVAVLVSGLVGWMLTITLCFCMKDFEGIVASPTGLPAAQIFLNAGGRTGGTIMWFWVILVQFYTGCSAMLADTRMAYAFARDDAFPLSRYEERHLWLQRSILTYSSVWSKVNRFTYTPVNAVWLVVSFSCALLCIGIGSTETVVSIFNITAPALDLSYVAVILAFLVYRHRIRFVRGPFHLAGWGRYVNVIAIVWVFLISVVLFFPTVRPVTAANM